MCTVLGSIPSTEKQQQKASVWWFTSEIPTFKRLRLAWAM